MKKQGILIKGEMQIKNILWSIPSQKGTINHLLKKFEDKKQAYTTATFMKILPNKGYADSRK